MFKKTQWVMLNDKQLCIVVGQKGEDYLLHKIDASGETIMRADDRLKRFVTDEIAAPASSLRPAELHEIPESRRPA